MLLTQGLDQIHLRVSNQQALACNLQLGCLPIIVCYFQQGNLFKSDSLNKFASQRRALFTKYPPTKHKFGFLRKKTKRWPYKRPRNRKINCEIQNTRCKARIALCSFYFASVLHSCAHRDKAASTWYLTYTNS